MRRATASGEQVSTSTVMGPRRYMGSRARSSSCHCPASGRPWSWTWPRPAAGAASAGDTSRKITRPASGSGARRFQDCRRRRRRATRPPVRRSRGPPPARSARKAGSPRSSKMAATGRPARRSTSRSVSTTRRESSLASSAGHGRLPRAHHAGERDGLSGSQRHRPGPPSRCRSRRRRRTSPGRPSRAPSCKIVWDCRNQQARWTSIWDVLATFMGLGWQKALSKPDRRATCCLSPVRRIASFFIRETKASERYLEMQQQPRGCRAPLT